MRDTAGQISGEFGCSSPSGPPLHTPTHLPPQQQPHHPHGASPSTRPLSTSPPGIWLDTWSVRGCTSDRGCRITSGLGLSSCWFLIGVYASFMACELGKYSHGV